MKDSNDLINQAVREAGPSSNNSPTAAGQADHKADKEALVDAINQTFTLFQLNYHNQFFSAFPAQQDQDFTKKLWLDSLSAFSPEQILQAAKAAIEQCEYLPNLHRMMELCHQQGPGGGLPSARDAYIEACNAPTPKAGHNWSHPAVYHAAVKTGWYLLASEVENKAFPSYEKKYREMCNRVLAGEKLTVQAPELLEEKAAEALPKSENSVRVVELKKLLD